MTVLRRILNWLVLLPIAVVAVVLAVANRTPVTVSLDPFGRMMSPLSITAPLFAVILLSVTVGVVLGGAAVWWKQGRYRKRARQAENQLVDAIGEQARLRGELQRGTEVAGGLPLLSNRTAA